MLTTQLLTCLLYSLLAGGSAAVYVVVLVEPGHVLAFWAAWLYRIHNWYVARNPEKRTHTADMMLKPILTCGYCVGGQLGLWGFLWLTWAGYPVLLYILTTAFTSLVGGVTATSLKHRA